MLPHVRRFSIGEVDVASLIRSTPVFWEYPVCDREPLPGWSRGRVTLLGDAAHAMYPVGSNGASQAILDAIALADESDQVARPGDLLRMPMGRPHGLFNRSGATVVCLFWVTPPARLYDLFVAIDAMKEQTPDAVVALAAQHEVEFLPPPES